MTLIGVIDLLKKSWSLYVENFKTLFLIAIWTILPAIAMGIVAALASYFPEGAWLLYSLLYVVAFVGAIIIGLWVHVSLTESIASYYKGQPVNVDKIYSGAWGKILPLLWVSIIVFVIVFAGTLLFVIPGILFGVWFAFATIINILEGKKGWSALKESKNLVSGKWWSVFWRFLAIYLLLMIIIWVITIPLFLLLSFGFAALAQAAGPDWIALIQSVITNLINVLALPLFTAIPIILYIELKKFKGSKQSA